LLGRSVQLGYNSCSQFLWRHGFFGQSLGVGHLTSRSSGRAKIRAPLNSSVRHGAMIRNHNLLGALLVALLPAVPTASFACSPAVERASSFVKRPPPNAVGFTGKVISVTSEKASRFGTPLKVTIKTEKWFLGQPRRIEQVRGFTTFNTANVPCHGAFDFHPKVGAEVIIFGQIIDGAVTRRIITYKTLPKVQFSYK
jgi:hypothetical protein